MKRIGVILLFGVILILAVLVQFKSDVEDSQPITINFAPAKSSLGLQEAQEAKNVDITRDVASSLKMATGIFFDEKLNPICIFQKLSKQKFEFSDVKQYTSHLGSSEAGAQDKVFVMVINDKHCPEGKFRIMRAALHKDAGWVVEKDIDCVNTTLEEQVAYGITIQGQIIDAVPEENFLHLAINGDGFFHLKCQGSDFLSRDGTFYRDRSGELKNAFGCQVLNKAELPIRWDVARASVNEKGCFASGDCFQIVPFAYLEELKNFKVNTELGMIELNSQQPLPSIASPQVMVGAIEDQKYSLLIKNSRYAEADIWENPPELVDCEK